MSDWLRRLLVWDGMLPLAVWGVPRAAQWLLPRERWPIEVFGVALPIVAFMARFLAGLAVVRRQRHRAVFRAVKVVILFFGLLFLMIIDVAMILKLVMPKGAFEQPGDLVGFAVLYGLYVAAMAVATWPGTRPGPDREAGFVDDGHAVGRLGDDDFS
ncbi:MAG: hypothetical protein FJ309_15970 [Planctomycetes bacterium]|nr:hypothetical protein [Planctomycetota bacterium]MBM4057458.1 hypothetical protein [Planctomycetota bacterium]